MTGGLASSIDMQPAAPVDRAAALAAGPSRIPRKFWYVVLAAAAALGIGGALLEHLLSAVGLTTIHLSRAEELLRGKAPSDELFAQAGEIASADCSPGADGRGPIDYKRHLAGVLTGRALRRATARALHREA